MKLKLPHSTQNWISLIGVTIVAITLFMIIFLFALSFFLGEGGSYLGLVTFILLPSVMVIGLLLIPLGMIRKISVEKKYGIRQKQDWPRVDLNDNRHRNAFFVFSIGTTIFLFLSAIGSYEAFHYSESTEFCGTLCHYVMQPEYTAYQHSPHARVACVSCHVGPGAGWYVKSKLSGLYQVYATLANKVPKPIPTPIHNLRPAREVCEQCHWPQKFYANKLRKETHYLSDEENSQWDIRMIVRIGAEQSAKGLEEGIHWHINPDVKVEYFTSDKQISQIPWVRYTNLKTGEITTYSDPDSELSETDINPEEIRTMDCIDCHNRPSHIYRPPSTFINSAMTSGSIPRHLPEIKSVALEICDAKYSTTDSAKAEIDRKIRTYYQENYPDEYSDYLPKIEQAISGLQFEFSKNIFPEMKVKWRVYPNHIGHLEFDGCFRCHDNNHRSKEGKVISKDCNDCHLINAQGTPGEMETAHELGNGLTFKHPVDIDMAWQEGNCTECHTGLNP